MLSSTLSDNRKNAELAVTTNINRGSRIIKSRTSSSSDLLRSSSTSSSSSDSEIKDQHQKEIKDSSRNTFFGRNMSPMYFLVVYNREILCFLTLFLTTYATFHNKYGARTPYYPINSRPIFDKDSVVEEFYKGELTPLQTKVSVSGISAILFYAPWSTNSIYVKQYFESVAKVFQNEIYFAAVNCWQPGGECRMQHGKVKSWPVLVIYYPKSLAVQYNGPWQLGPIYKFLIGVLRPLRRLHSYNELKLFNTYNSVTVVGFFSKISGKYQSFYQSAAKWLEYDPLQDVKFCAVVGDVLKDFNIKNESEIQIFYRGNRLVENFSSWSVNSIVNSLKKNTKSLEKYWSGYHRQDKQNLENNLKNNPTLLYFVKRDYINDNYTTELLLNEVIEAYENKLKLIEETKKSLNNSNGIENIENLYNSSTSGNIITRKNEINHSLSYCLLDLFMYYKIAFQLGLSNSNFKLQQSTAVIVDNFKESVYMFPSQTPLTKENLLQFLDDYQVNNLKRNFRNKELPKKLQTHSHSESVVASSSNNDNNNKIINIPEINGTKFYDLIQNRKTNNSTSIILITSTTCSLCSILKLNILRITKFLRNLPIIFYKIDGNNNDFIWKYTMGQYPTLLIIPKFNNNENSESIDDIRILPYDIEPNEKNILGFIMANIEIKERLFGLLKYCENLKVSNGFYNCIKKTRQIIHSIINEQLILWRKFPLKRKCIKNNLEVLRELYYKLTNSKNGNDVKSAFTILNIPTRRIKPVQTNHIDIRNFSCDNDVIKKNNLLTS